MIDQRPKIGFGTYRLKGNDAVDCVYSALRIGYRSIDTASVYRNEREIGIALQKAFSEGFISR